MGCVSTLQLRCTLLKVEVIGPDLFEDERGEAVVVNSE